MIRIHLPTEQYGFIEIEVDEPREKAVEIYNQIKKDWEEAKEKQRHQTEKEKDEAEQDFGLEEINLDEE